VGTCKDALEALAESPYDIIVLDLGLPAGDASSCSGLASQRFNEPVLILSAAIRSKTASGPRRGADDYLPKPFSFRSC